MIIHSVLHRGIRMDKRDHIMQAALALFAERGYHGTPVSMIAEKAKVGSGTIYRYFKDKDDLVNTLYRTWKAVLFERTMAGLDATLHLRSLFHEIWKRMAEFAMEHRDAFIFMEAHHHSPYLDDASKQLSNTINGHFVALLVRGQEQEMIQSAPPELIKSVVFGTFTEMVKNHWSGTQELTDTLVTQVEEMCWRAIRR